MNPQIFRPNGSAFCVLAFCFLAAGVAPVNPAQAQDTDPLAVIESVLKSRAALQSGVFHAAVVQRTIAEGGNERVSVRELHCVFDSATNRVVYNCNGMEQLVVMAAAEPLPDTIEELKNRIHNLGARLRAYRAGLARNASYMVEWHAIGNRDQKDHATSNIDLRDPETPSVGPFSIPLNPDWAGAAIGREIESGKSLREIFEFPLRGEVSVKTMRTKAGDIELVFSTPSQRRTFRIRPKMDYTCSQMETVTLDDKGEALPYRRSLAKAEWQQVQGVYVPVSMATEDLFRDGTKRTALYSFEWDKVNPENLDDVDFSYNGIDGIWEGLTIFDRRGGKRKIIGTYHRRDQIIEQETRARYLPSSSALGVFDFRLFPPTDRAFRQCFARCLKLFRRDLRASDE
ncbi:MAG: hypothetical protein R3C19_26200 [Planctomycetaceae bacterium]